MSRLIKRGADRRDRCFQFVGDAVEESLLQLLGFGHDLRALLGGGEPLFLRHDGKLGGEGFEQFALFRRKHSFGRKLDRQHALDPIGNEQRQMQRGRLREARQSCARQVVSFGNAHAATPSSLEATSMCLPDERAR